MLTSIEVATVKAGHDYFHSHHSNSPSTFEAFALECVHWHHLLLLVFIEMMTWAEVATVEAGHDMYVLLSIGRQSRLCYYCVYYHYYYYYYYYYYYDY
jgi:hypothetical protein